MLPTPDEFFVAAHQEYIAPLLEARAAQIVGRHDRPALGGTLHALDVAAGAGRHGLWLAERGWNVSFVDAAAEGLEIARKHSLGRNVEVEFVRRDLELVHAAESERWAQQFDLVLVFFYLQRSLFPVLADALKPGGLLLYKTYTDEQRKFGGGPSNPEYLLRPGELLRAFPTLRVLHYHETVTEHGVAELVATKETA